jgi:putative ABC transport system permease protein
MLTTSFALLGDALRRLTLASNHGRLASIVGIVSLAIGIASWSLCATLLFERSAPSAYPESERLALLGARDASGECRQCIDLIARSTVDDWRSSDALSAVAAFTSRSMIFGRFETPLRVSTALVDGDFFRVLGTTPRIGRVLDAHDQDVASDGAVVISHDLWQRQFGGDPSAVGGPLTLDGRRYVLVGVMPPRFDFPQRTQVWLPLSADETVGHFDRQLLAVARLHPLVISSLAETRLPASRAVSGDSAQIARLVPLSERDGGSGALSVRVFGASALVLLIGLINFSMLGSYRLAEREHDLAIRVALGATRGVLLRDAAADIALQSTAAAVLAGVLGCWSLYIVAAWTQMAVVGTLQWHVVVLALASAALTGLVVLLLQAPQLNRMARGSAVVRSGISQVGPSLRTRRLQGLFVATQAGLALVCSAVAVYLFMSNRALHAVDLGVDGSRVLVSAVAPPKGQDAKPEAQGLYVDDVLDRLLRVPGVERSAAWRVAQLGEGLPRGAPLMDTEQRVGESDRRRLPHVVMEVTADFFRTVGMTVLEGRTFSTPASAGDEGEVVVNARAAALLWPDRSAVGQRLRVRDGTGQGEWRTVVGVVANARAFEPLALLKAIAAPDRPTPMLFRPLSAEATSPLTVGVRTSAEQQLRPLLYWAALKQAAPDAVVESSTSLFDAMSAQVADVRWTRDGARLMAGGAVIAIVLVMAGLYGVISDVLRARGRELAIRRALGASPRSLLFTAARPVIQWLALGLGCGVLALGLGGGALRVLLFRVSPIEPTVLLTGAILIIACGLLTCIAPLRRALLVEPAIMIREE